MKEEKTFAFFWKKHFGKNIKQQKTKAFAICWLNAFFFFKKTGKTTALTDIFFSDAVIY
jgi:hypothetical protein